VGTMLRALKAPVFSRGGFQGLLKKGSIKKGWNDMAQFSGGRGDSKGSPPKH